MSTAVAPTHRGRGIPSPARLTIAFFLGLGALASSTGFVAATVFGEPSLPKYVITVGVFAFAAWLVVAERPALVVACLTVFLIPVANLEGTFKGIAVTLLVPLCVGSIGLRAIGRPRAWHPSAMASATVVALALLALPLANGDGRREVVTALIAMIAVAWIVASVRRDGGTHAIIWAFVASAAVQALVAYWEFATGAQPNLYGGAGSRAFGDDYFFGFEGLNRPVGTFFDPISLGNMLAISLPLALYLATRRTARTAERLLAAVAGVLIGIALVFTLSRMSWIGATAGLLVGAVLMPRGVRGPAVLGLAVLAGVGTAGGVAVTGSAITERVTSIFSPTSDQASTSAGDELRQRVYADDIAIWEEHPVVGVGMGDLTPELVARTPELTLQGHAHSVYLGLLGQGGVLGLLAVLVVLGTAFGTAIRARSTDPVLAAAVVGSLVAVAIVWSTDYTIRYFHVAAMFGVVFGIAAGLRPGRPHGAPA